MRSSKHIHQRINHKQTCAAGEPGLTNNLTSKIPSDIEGSDTYLHSYPSLSPSNVAFDETSPETRKQTQEKNNTSIKNFDLCPVEYLEFPKLNDNGKIVFLDNEGNKYSTEEIVQNHFKRLGYKIVRGEVRFWQAMYGLAFWDEIFQGVDIEFTLNDIPLD